jgi:hypothetical protein
MRAKVKGIAMERYKNKEIYSFDTSIASSKKGFEHGKKLFIETKKEKVFHLLLVIFTHTRNIILY